MFSRRCGNGKTSTDDLLFCDPYFKQSACWHAVHCAVDAVLGGLRVHFYAHFCAHFYARCRARSNRPAELSAELSAITNANARACGVGHTQTGCQHA